MSDKTKARLRNNPNSVYRNIFIAFLSYTIRILVLFLTYQKSTQCLVRKSFCKFQIFFIELKMFWRFKIDVMQRHFCNFEIQLYKSTLTIIAPVTRNNDEQIERYFLRL